MGPLQEQLAASGATPRYRAYVLLLLTLTYTLNIADRFVLSTLIEPIKQEFGLSDSGVAFLTGTSLAIFYVAAGIPLGIVADRWNRRNMIAWAKMIGITPAAFTFNGRNCLAPPNWRLPTICLA